MYGYSENGDYYGERWHDDDAHIDAWRQWRKLEPGHSLRPFRFEDLNGKREPAHWGPVYPKTASQAVEKWRRQSNGRELTAEEKAKYGLAVHAWINGLNAPKKTAGTLPTTSNCASGQAHEYDCEKHKAKLRAALYATPGHVANWSEYEAAPKYRLSPAIVEALKHSGEWK